MKKMKITSLNLCNILCGLLLLALVVCQFIPFWTVGEETASLIGMTGRQYAHEDMIEKLDELTNGFSYQDISVQVLISIVLGAFGAFLCFKNSSRWLGGLLGVVCALASGSLWLLVPAYTLGQLGNAIFILDIVLLVFSALVLVLFFVNKKNADENEED